ncbi:hypothetical protein BJ508DRAFT_178182 [Ascobolus immersus RN42]|uniref:Uncharacterized protein n=1 Tax=Ascobolus immersus RN42 TaxID=1160509 RepID=A0A3N4IN47_ASCIM|nr:hypothetical protein BJ508DRAFT_178182 [Ascobolus immersus RN42]
MQIDRKIRSIQSTKHKFTSAQTGHNNHLAKHNVFPFHALHTYHTMHTPNHSYTNSKSIPDKANTNKVGINNEGDTKRNDSANPRGKKKRNTKEKEFKGR